MKELSRIQSQIMRIFKEPKDFTLGISEQYILNYFYGDTSKTECRSALKELVIIGLLRRLESDHKCYIANMPSDIVRTRLKNEKID